MSQANISIITQSYLERFRKCQSAILQLKNDTFRKGNVLDRTSLGWVINSFCNEIIGNNVHYFEKIKNNNKRNPVDESIRLIEKGWDKEKCKFQEDCETTNIMIFLFIRYYIRLAITLCIA